MTVRPRRCVAAQVSAGGEAAHDAALPAAVAPFATEVWPAAVAAPPAAAAATRSTRSSAAGAAPPEAAPNPWLNLQSRSKTGANTRKSRRIQEEPADGGGAVDIESEVEAAAAGPVLWRARPGEDGPPAPAAGDGEVPEARPDEAERMTAAAAGVSAKRKREAAKAVTQAELVARAFVVGHQEKDFEAQKEKVVEAAKPDPEPEVAKGWGAWTGMGVKKSRTKNRLPKPAPKLHTAPKRKDGSLQRVLINEQKVRLRYRIARLA
jgi:U3 small nucleolar RNA-associated protein 14